jgi:small-conductance mechanosensitive channel
MRHGVVLPAKVTERFPALEMRLNTFVPQALFVLRLIVVLAVSVYALQVIGMIDYSTWAAGGGSEVILQVATVLIILLVAFILWLILSSWVEYRLNPAFGRPATARETTLLTLLRNATTIAILVITLMVALSELGLNIAPLLASAGVLGLAIGFGAQKMVQDIITGVFIQFENAINVGDVVTTGGITGAVEKLTVRSVSLRDLNGVYHIIPFSSVDMVSNFTREFSYHVADMGIAYRENIDEARDAMFEGFEELKADPDEGANIIGDFEWFGVESLGDSAVVMRARIKTLPGKQWGVGRAYNGIMKKIFDARGIEIPFPHQTVYFGENKDGSTTSLRLTRDDVGAGDSEGA